MERVAPAVKVAAMSKKAKSSNDDVREEAGPSDVDERAPWRDHPFSKLLRERRAAAGLWNPRKGEREPLSYRKLAERTEGKVSHTMIHDLERGLRRPLRDPERIRALAEGLGNVSYEQLMEAAGYMRPSGRWGPDLTTALVDLGLSEDEIQEVENFVAFIAQRSGKRLSQRPERKVRRPL